MNTTHERYRWGAYNSYGTLLWSRIYDDFDECYKDYVQAMSTLRDIGTNLALYEWRGVFNLEQAALLVSDRDIYTYKLDITEGD